MESRSLIFQGILTGVILALHLLILVIIIAYFYTQKRKEILICGFIALFLLISLFLYWKEGVFTERDLSQLLREMGCQENESCLGYKAGYIGETHVVAQIVTPYWRLLIEPGYFYKPENLNTVEFTSPLRVPYTATIMIRKEGTEIETQPKQIDPQELKQVIEDGMVDFNTLNLKIDLQKDALVTKAFGNPFDKRKYYENVINSWKFHQRIRDVIMGKVSKK